MRHQVDGRKFGRKTSHRKAMFRNMANSVILDEQVVTTVEKAKEVRRVVDRLITIGKSGIDGKRRLAFDRTRDKLVVNKLFDTLSKRYEKREGGYTRVVKLSERRRGDAAEMAILELVDHPPIDRARKVKPTEDKKAETEQAQEADPFRKFRLVFAGKRRSSVRKQAGASTAKKASPAKATATKPAAKKKTAAKKKPTKK